MLLEVIVQTVEDAVAAADGGADRLEVVRDLSQGGLTPALSLVAAIRDATPLPLRVMLRENGGFTLLDAEIDTCRRAAAAFAALGVDGLVVGFEAGGRPVMHDVARVIEDAPDLPVTFHRAFDRLDDPLGAIETIAALSQIDRILTSGGEGSAEARAARLCGYADKAGRVRIIAGGGVDEALLSRLLDGGIVQEAHVGRAARRGGLPDSPVTVERVRALRRLAGTSGAPGLSARP